MSDKTCKTCKHWNTEPMPSGTHRVCNLIPFVIERMVGPDYDREVLCKDDDYAGESPLAVDMAGAMDGSGYWGKIVTGPDFGCVKHEEARPPTP